MSDKAEGNFEGPMKGAGIFTNFLQTMLGKGSGAFNESFAAMTNPGAAVQKVLADAFDGKTPPTIG